MLLLLLCFGCLQYATTSPSPISYATTCCDPADPACDSPSSLKPWCNRSKSFSQRAKLLAAELTLAEQLELWAFGRSTPPVLRLNLKGQASNGQTCIHGVEAQPAPGVPVQNVTVTAHAINLGATFDVDLVAAVSNMTRIEMRGLTQKQYHLSKGEYVANQICSGGPLANSAHDPRWGRIAETYGEDPYLISRIGTTATRMMQAATETHANDDIYLATAQVTRHLIGAHGSNQMPSMKNCSAEKDGFPTWQCGTHMTVSPRDAADQVSIGST
jgi:beta-glucosidase